MATPGLRDDKVVTRWQSERLDREVTLVRWGTVGKPVLLFPTAGGDAEEIERFQMIDALGPLIDRSAIKVYSCDSAAGSNPSIATSMAIVTGRKQRTAPSTAASTIDPPRART